MPDISTFIFCGKYGIPPLVVQARGWHVWRFRGGGRKKDIEWLRAAKILPRLVLLLEGALPRFVSQVA